MTPLTPLEKDIILQNINIFFDEDVVDPYSVLAGKLGCSRSVAKTKYFQFLYTDLGHFQRNFVRKDGLMVTYLTRELSRVRGTTRVSVFNEALDFAERELEAFIQRRG